MDFSKTFQSQFASSPDYIETDLSLNKKLQDTRHALQESQSETDQLSELINQLYGEVRVENVATTELLAQVKGPLFRNMPLPRNADNLSLNEKAGYVLFYMKFLGYAARKATEEYHVTKEHLEGMHKTVTKNTVEMKVKRTGALKVPDLDGVKEMKRSDKPTAPLSPPTTPPKQSEDSSGKKKSK